MRQGISEPISDDRYSRFSTSPHFSLLSCMHDVNVYAQPARTIPKIDEAEALGFGL